MWGALVANCLSSIEVVSTSRPCYHTITTFILVFWCRSELSRHILLPFARLERTYDLVCKLFAGKGYPVPSARAMDTLGCIPPDHDPELVLVAIIWTCFRIIDSLRLPSHRVARTTCSTRRETRILRTRYRNTRTPGDATGRLRLRLTISVVAIPRCDSRSTPRLGANAPNCTILT